MRFDIVTIFPDIFDSYLNESLIKRGIAKKIIKVKTHNLRDYSLDRHNKVDDRPYGGGPGMVMAVEPIYRAVKTINSKFEVRSSKKRVILFSTRGKKLDAKTAKRLSKYDSLILICGRYEGVDERVAKYIADEEISIGNYVLNGGELAAMVLIETVSRFLPGFLGKMESLEEIKGSYAAYTRPAEFVPKKGTKPWRVPKVLLSGHHYKIKEFRK
ncbi:MAG: tRNA (guanosine(37)-N1)-methyltransferase TrmD [bacterium]|nr:tRNA (guanosine(37)-N1)-methyltransferase TrmD [bacterium]